MTKETTITFTDDEWNRICQCYEDTLKEIDSEGVYNFIDKIDIKFNEDGTVDDDFQERMSDEDWEEYSRLAQPVVEIDFSRLRNKPAESWLDTDGGDLYQAAFSEWKEASNDSYQANIAYLCKVGANNLDIWDAIQKMTAIVCCLGY